MIRFLDVWQICNFGTRGSLFNYPRTPRAAEGLTEGRLKLLGEPRVDQTDVLLDWFEQPLPKELRKFVGKSYPRSLPCATTPIQLPRRDPPGQNEAEFKKNTKTVKNCECGASWIHVISSYLEYFRRETIWMGFVSTRWRSIFFARDPSSFGSTQTASGQGGEMMMKLLMVWGMPSARLTCFCFKMPGW